MKQHREEITCLAENGVLRWGRELSGKGETERSLFEGDGGSHRLLLGRTW